MHWLMGTTGISTCVFLCGLMGLKLFIIFYAGQLLSDLLEH